jgi:hypothetical protein
MEQHIGQSLLRIGMAIDQGKILVGQFSPPAEKNGYRRRFDVMVK